MTALSAGGILKTGSASCRDKGTKDRYNRCEPVLTVASSPVCGDDGAIQIWEMESGEHVATLRRDRPYERLDITGIKGLTDAQKQTLKMMGAIEQMSNGGWNNTSTAHTRFADMA